jgi:hypothetical protein
MEFDGKTTAIFPYGTIIILGDITLDRLAGFTNRHPWRPLYIEVNSAIKY